MNPVDRGNREYPPCGYGLLGLCCSDCLRGPCRISPFEKVQTLCGADSDLLVAGNLCQLAGEEFAPVLQTFLQVAGEFRKRNESTGAPSQGWTENLSLKYGIPAEAIIPFLRKETTGLLDPSVDHLPAIFSSLFPQKVFRQTHLSNRGKSFLSDFLGLLNWKNHRCTDPEALLRRCLNSAIWLLALEELTRDILSLLHPLPPGADLPNLPDLPQPVLVSLVEEEYPQSQEMQEMAAALTEGSGALSISLNGNKGLIRVCHMLQEKWHRPIFDLSLAVLVESPNIMSTLAPLALGIPTVSNPSLPIQGSKKVEEFFYSGLSKEMGNFYLPLRDETLYSRLSRVLVP